MDNLIGSDTVNTVPPAALDAFIDHGRVELTLDKDPDLAIAQLEALNTLGIDLEKITQTLQDEGVKAFENSFLSLMNSLSQKQGQLLSANSEYSANLGDYQGRIEEAMREIKKDEVVKRIWEKDYTLWKKEPAEITNRLGWLDIAERMKTALPELIKFVSGIRRDGFTSALLLGMGGSSLAPKVFRDTFGVSEGYLDLEVLDSTDPETILAQTDNLDLPRTLFIVSTKSGGTVETISLFKYFYNQLAVCSRW